MFEYFFFKIIDFFKYSMTPKRRLTFKLKRIRNSEQAIIKIFENSFPHLLGLSGDSAEEIFRIDYDGQGDDWGQTFTLFDLDDSNLLALDCKSDRINVDKIEENILNGSGLTVPVMIRSDTLPIYRSRTVFWSILKFWQIHAPKVPGMECQFEEVESLNYLNEETFTRTSEYNKLLITTLRGAAMVKSLRLSEEIFGHIKSPFDTPKNRYVRKFQDIFTTSEWFKARNVSFLNEIECDLAFWSDSINQQNREAVSSFALFLKNKLATFQNRAKLFDRDHWLNEIKDPVEYSRLLTQYSEVQSLILGFFEHTMNLVWDNLNDCSHDLAIMTEHVIKRFVLRKKIG